MATNTTPSATCGLCSELYTDPRMLNCLHSFCKKCLQKVFEEQGVSKASLKCPTCNESSPIPEQGVNALAKDHRKSYEAEIAQYEAKMKTESSIPCDQCVRTSKNTAMSFCCTCCEFLCEMCSDHHRSWRKTLNHELVNCTKGDGGKGTKSALKNISHKILHCQVHTNEILNFYCNTCSCLLCLHCIVLKHKDHDYSEMEVVKEKEKSDLLSYLGKAESARDKLKDSISRGEKVVQQVQAAQKDVDKSIEETFDRLNHSLQNRRKVLLGKSSEIALGKVTALTLQGEDLKRMEDALSEMCGKISAATHEYTAVEMLSAKRPMATRLQSLLEQFDKCSLEPCKQEMMVVFLESSQLEKDLANFGSVTGGCCPARSTIDLHMFTASVNKTKSMIVTARDIDGKPFPHGGEQVRGTLSLRSSNQAPVVCTTTDNEDGTYTLTFVPTSVGKHELSITISNEPIERSPFEIYVRQSRSYTSLSCSHTFSLSSYPGDVAVDNSGNVYVADSGYHCISVFDQNGSNVHTIGNAGSVGSGDGQFYNPYGIALKGDIMYVCEERNNRVQKLTTSGQFLSKFGSTGSGNGQLSGLQGICLDPNGRVFVSECSNRRVSVFESDGTFSHHIQGNSSDGSNLVNPWGMAFDPTGNLHVADYGSHSIKVFTPDGRFVSQYGSGVIQYPAGIAIDDEGVTFIGEYHNTNSSYNYGCLFILNAQHQLISTVQNHKYAVGVCLDNDGFVYVCDRNNCRVMKY